MCALFYRFGMLQKIPLSKNKMTMIKLSCCLLWSLLLGGASAFQVRLLSSPRQHSFYGRRRRLDHSFRSSTQPPTLLATSVQLVDISQGTERDIGTMDEWAVAYGVQKAEGFEYTSSDNGQDIYVMTTQDLPAESPVLFVPADLILTSTAARQELAGPGLEAAEELLDTLQIGDQRAQFALFLKILVEYQQGDQSPWFPWLNAMPRTYYNGASMTGKFVPSSEISA